MSLSKVVRRSLDKFALVRKSIVVSKLCIHIKFPVQLEFLIDDDNGLANEILVVLSHPLFNRGNPFIMELSTHLQPKLPHYSHPSVEAVNRTALYQGGELVLLCS